MAYGPGLSRVISRSNIRWVGPTTKSARTAPSVGIGLWSVVPLRFVGGRLPSSRTARNLHPSTYRPCLSRLNHKKSGEPGRRPNLAWPQALRQVRAWLEPYILLKRYWQAFSPLPPPLPLQHLLDWLWHSNAINV